MRARARIGAIVAIAIAAGLGAWLASRGGGSHPQSGSTTGKKVAAVSASGLRTLSRALGQPIYWAGLEPGDTYELTQTADGRIYVRYLPSGAQVGTPRALLTVGTYPLADAFSSTTKVAHRSDSVRLPAPGHGVAFYSRSSPTNIYLAYPGSGYQIEVFDPSAARARQVVLSGRVTPVEGSGAPAQASVTQLEALASSLGHPIYWVGEEPATTYELTQTSDDRVYIRYLPQGDPIGTTSPFLTIGTYPLANAFAVTRGLAGEAGNVGVPVGGGGIAFYARSRPTNVYVAFPGKSSQVEVYDPSPAEARRLVTSGRLVTIG